MNRMSPSPGFSRASARALRAASSRRSAASRRSVALGGFAAAGAWDDSVAWWALLVALVLTWVSGLDYARSAPALFRGRATPA